MADLSNMWKMTKKDDHYIAKKAKYKKQYELHSEALLPITKKILDAGKSCYTTDEEMKDILQKDCDLRNRDRRQTFKAAIMLQFE